jgi:hypothetical protein
MAQTPSTFQRFAIKHDAVGGVWHLSALLCRHTRTLSEVFPAGSKNTFICFFNRGVSAPAMELIPVCVPNPH